jgi:CheY-like chemotaxis protein
VRDRFATALLSAGHTALTVKSAAELLARVRADLEKIDLIVLDLRLPHAGGVDLVRSIRKLDAGRLPILVFSGTIATAEEVRDLAAMGVAGYVNECSTSCRRSRRICFPTTSTAAEVRGSCWAFPSPIGSGTPSLRRSP